MTALTWIVAVSMIGIMAALLHVGLGIRDTLQERRAAVREMRTRHELERQALHDSMHRGARPEPRA